MTIETRPIEGRGFGIRVCGISHRSLEGEEVRQRLRDLLAEHGLIVLEGMEPDHRLQVAVGEVFGKVKDYPPGQRGRIGDEEVSGVGEMISTPEKCTVIEIDGQQLANWMPWHIDQCYHDRPNIARVLRCGRLAPTGGMTGFLDGAELYESLDPQIRARVEACSITYVLNLALEDLKFGVPPGFRIVRKTRASASAPSGADAHTATHRAVRTARSGRKVLFVSPWMATGIAGGSDAEGDALLESVAREIQTLGRSLAYFHDWQLSDMLIWDNLRMLHSSSGIDPAHSRIMYRTTVSAA